MIEDAGQPVGDSQLRRLDKRRGLNDLDVVQDPNDVLEVIQRRDSDADITAQAVGHVIFV